MSLSHDIWGRQYAVAPDETIEQGSVRVASHVASAEGSRHSEFTEKFAQLMRENRFWPGGRVLAGAGTAHGNVLNCFVQDGSPYQPGSSDAALATARKLALVTKVGGGNGVNLDPYPAKKPYPHRIGRLALHIDPHHPDADNVRQGRYKDLVIGEYRTQGYRRVESYEGDPNWSDWYDIAVEDSVEDIWAAAAEMVIRLLEGEDVVVDLSALRPEGAPVNGSGGSSSGPASFAVEIFDNFAYWASLGGAEHAGPVATLRYVFAPTLRAIRQGGTRRGAGMATLSVSHPDVRDFITAKDLAREAREGDIGTFNISVLTDDDFMEQANQSGSATFVYKQLLGEIAKHAWQTGEPGLIFIDRINEYNPLVESDGPILATNPCGEVPLYPGEPCDLGAIVLSSHLRKDHISGSLEVDYPKLRETVKLAVRFLDDVLTVEHAPLEEIRLAILDKRRIGLGVMGLADMLIKLGLRYDSTEATALVNKVINAIRDEAQRTSVELGRERSVPEGVKRAGLSRRNIALLTVAPTGTTSMLADCSSGIEPVFAGAYTRRIGTDYVAVVHPLLTQILSEHTPTNGYALPDAVTISGRRWNFEQLAHDIQAHHGSLLPLLEKLPKDARLSAFVTAHDVAPLDHVTMQAVVQRAFDREGKLANSISKTINLPHGSTVSDVMLAYTEAWRMGCKGITVYRDGSRELQVLTTSSTTTPELPVVPVSAVATDSPVSFSDIADDFVREMKEHTHQYERNSGKSFAVVKRPARVTGSSYKYDLGGKKVYVQVFTNDEGEIVELWTPPYKSESSEYKSAHDIVGRLASMALKYGAPIDELIRVFEGHYDESAGIVRKHGYVDSKWQLVADSLKAESLRDALVLSEPMLSATINTHKGHDCPDCAGTNLIREEGCLKCYDCGFSRCG
jgi:ribonucleoside-diphosphate reductase alpha chain